MPSSILQNIILLIIPFFAQPVNIIGYQILKIVDQAVPKYMSM